MQPRRKDERSVSDILYIALTMAICAMIAAVFVLTFFGEGERAFFYPILLLLAFSLNLLLSVHFLTRRRRMGFLFALFAVVLGFLLLNRLFGMELLW